MKEERPEQGAESEDPETVRAGGREGERRSYARAIDCEAPRRERREAYRGRGARRWGVGSAPPGSGPGVRRTE